MNHAPRLITEWGILDSKKITKKSISKMDAKIGYTIKSKSGLVKESGVVPFKSFVSNFARILNYGFCNVANTSTITAADGSAPATSVHTFDVEETAKASPTASAYGIWVGNVGGNAGITLNAPNSGIGGDPGYDDNLLYNEIPADGDASAASDTDLVYGATTTYVDSGTVLRVTRRFTNNNASAIRISEVGLLGNDGTDNILVCRDKIRSSTNAWVSLASGDIIDISYIFTVSDSGGFTKNFLRYLSSEMAGGDSVENIVDTSGAAAARNFTAARVNKNMLATANDDTFGIQVGGVVAGTGTIDPESGVSLSSSSYKLSKKLSDDDIDYGATTALNTTDVTQLDGYSRFGVYRDFENEGDDAIYINEYGLVVDHDASGTYYMLVRSSITGTGVPYVVLQPGKILRIKASIAFPLETYTSPVYDNETDQTLT